MGKKGRHIQGAMAAIGLLVLIFGSSLALEGARAGMELCMKTVIPSLFPFFVLSIVLTNTLDMSASKPVQVLTRILGIPEAAISVLIPAVLGGYPVGAKCVGDLYQNTQITRDDAERMLAFCSNAGPSFLFGMVSGFFPERKMVWLLWFIHICSSALTAVAIPVKPAKHHVSQPVKKIDNRSIILSAAKAMCLVCCWVVLFRIVITFLNSWFLWAFPTWVQVMLIGILELTNGCCALSLIADVNLRFVICAGMLSFGGICVLLQTISVTNGLSIRHYVAGKLLQTVFSLLLTSLFVWETGVYFTMLIPFMVVILRKTQNRYSNPRELPV